MITLSDISYTLKDIKTSYLAFFVYFVLVVLSLALFSNKSHAVELPVPNNFGGEFTLDSTMGKKVSLSDYRGKKVLLNFGYTSCPDVCPLVLAKLSRILKEVDKAKVQVLFISVDKERDTLAKMKKYLAFYDESIIGLNGNKEIIDEIFLKYGGSVHKHVDENNFVTFSHKDYIYVIDEEGYVNAFYGSELSYKELSNALGKHL